MKNTFIGLIIISVITLWVFYFVKITPSKFIKANQTQNIPTIANVSIYPSVTLTPTADIFSNQENDINIVKELIATKYNKKVTDIDLNVSEYDGSHLWGYFKFILAMEGGWILAAKNNLEQWVIVQDGNGTISCELIAPYDFPAIMVPECVNKNGKLIKF